MNSSEAPYIPEVLWVALGVALTIIGYGAVRLGITIWRILTSFEASLREAVKLTKAFQGDFELLRKVFLGLHTSNEQLNSNQPPEDEGEVGNEDPTRRPKVTGFPAPVFDRFKQEQVPEPDAEPGDGGEATGNDEDIIQAERIDLLKDAGFVVGDPNEVHPGREVDAP